MSAASRKLAIFLNMPVYKDTFAPRIYTIASVGHTRLPGVTARPILKYQAYILNALDEIKREDPFM